MREKNSPSEFSAIFVCVSDMFDAVFMSLRRRRHHRLHLIWWWNLLAKTQREEREREIGDLVGSWHIDYRVIGFTDLNGKTFIRCSCTFFQFISLTYFYFRYFFFFNPDTHTHTRTGRNHCLHWNVKNVVCDRSQEQTKPKIHEFFQIEMQKEKKIQFQMIWWLNAIYFI